MFKGTMAKVVVFLCPNERSVAFQWGIAIDTVLYEGDNGTGRWVGR